MSHDNLTETEQERDKTQGDMTHAGCSTGTSKVMMAEASNRSCNHVLVNWLAGGRLGKRQVSGEHVFSEFTHHHHSHHSQSKWVSWSELGETVEFVRWCRRPVERTNTVWIIDVARLADHENRSAVTNATSEAVDEQDKQLPNPRETGWSVHQQQQQCRDNTRASWLQVAGVTATLSEATYT